MRAGTKNKMAAQHKRLSFRKNADAIVQTTAYARPQWGRRWSMLLSAERFSQAYAISAMRTTCERAFDVRDAYQPPEAETEDKTG